MGLYGILLDVDLQIKKNSGIGSLWSVMTQAPAQVKDGPPKFPEFFSSCPMDQWVWRRVEVHSHWRNEIAMRTEKKGKLGNRAGLDPGCVQRIFKLPSCCVSKQKRAWEGIHVAARYGDMGYQLTSHLHPGIRFVFSSFFWRPSALDGNFKFYPV